jgi:hypothetical protein
MVEAVHSPSLGNDFVRSRSERSSQPKWMRWTGWGISGLMIALLLFDSISKLAFERHVVEATTKIGYPLDAIRPLGIICLFCTILYAIPRTALPGWHYTLKYAVAALQLVDLTCTAFRKIAKSAPKLRKLG